MARRHHCRHERAQFHSVQQLGSMPAIELWQCPVCKTTIAKETLTGETREEATAA